MKLIIGGSGYIGRNLMEYFLGKNEEVIATCHNSRKEGMIPFDMEDPNLDILGDCLKKIDCAFICSAVTAIDECKRDKERAYKINVSGTKKVAEQLFSLKIVPVFLSSDFVFDGRKGDYSEKDETSPCTVYGNHKKAIEDWLKDSKEEFFIARLSKIFGIKQGDKTILTSWVEQLRRGEVIRCANDQFFSPTYIGDLARAFDISLEKGLRGLYNVASPEVFSRYELALKLKSQLGITSGRIVPCSINDFNFYDNRSLNTSMNTEKFTRETGFEFNRMEDCIRRLC